MKKQLLISSLILFLAHNFIYAIEIDKNYLFPLDDSTETIEKERKNAIEIELFGKGVFYSLNYSRKLFTINSINTHLGTGFSFLKNNPSSIQKLIAPTFIIISKQFKQLEINIGGGFNILFSPKGTNKNRDEFWIESEYSYLYKRVGESIGKGYYYPKLGIDKYFFIGTNYSFNNTYMGICYYYAWFFNHYFSDSFLKSHYFGLKYGLRI